MKLAGQEVVFRVSIPMRSAKRGLKLCDVLREKMLSYMAAEDESALGEFQTLWAEFVELAFESPEKVPPVDALDSHELLAALQGFTEARSRVKA